jgi:hypothetical protein
MLPRRTTANYCLAIISIAFFPLDLTTLPHPTHVLSLMLGPQLSVVPSPLVSDGQGKSIGLHDALQASRLVSLQHLLLLLVIVTTSTIYITKTAITSCIITTDTPTTIIIATIVATTSTATTTDTTASSWRLVWKGWFDTFAAVKEFVVWIFGLWCFVDWQVSDKISGKHVACIVPPWK